MALSFVSRAVPSFEKKYGALSAESLARPEPPDASNGARYFEAAGRLADLSHADIDLLRALEGTENELADGEREQLLAMAETNRLPLELLAAGARQSTCEFLPAPPHAGAPLPPPLSYIGLARLTTELERFASREGRSPSAPASLESLFAISTCLQRERGFVFQIVGRTLERRALDAVHRGIEEGRRDLPLAAIEQRLPEESSLPELAESVRFELVSFRQPAFAERSSGSIWHPLHVDGFIWTSIVRGKERALDALSEPNPPGVDPDGPWLLPSTAAFEMSLPQLREWFERRHEQSLLRAVARRAIRVRSEALQSGAYHQPGAELASAHDPSVVELLDDGSALVSIPESARRTVSAVAEPRARQPPRWAWRLPPIPHPAP